VDLGIPELTGAQIEEASQLAEAAARKQIFSQINPKQIQDLTISVEAEGTAPPVNFSVEVDLVLQPNVKDADEKALADAAVKEAFRAIEEYLRKLT
jgi:hypothetical protein